MLNLLKSALRDFSDDECPVRAASLAYSTIFALPPLLILLLFIAGTVWNPEQVQRAMESQFATLVGTGGARAVQEMLSAKRLGAGGLITTIFGALGLILGAIGAFMQLQSALNRAWDVKPDPKQGGVKNFIGKRLLSLGMVLGVAFLLIVSLALSAGVSALGHSLRFFPEGAAHIVDIVLSFTVLAVLFAAIFRFLPDAKVEWKDAWLGGLVTSLLFVIGKFIIGFYLGRSNPGNAFGAASALAVILVWIYYAGMIVLFGAELTQAWAAGHGREIEPKAGAVRVERSEKPEASRKTERHDGGRTAMDRNQNDAPRYVGRNDGNGRIYVSSHEESSIGDLFKRLSADSSHLFRQEVSLAKAELRETTSRMAKTVSGLGVAFALALPGSLALTAFLVIVLGNAMHNYWASSLIVGVVLLAIAGLMARRGLAQMKKGTARLRESAASLRDDTQFVKEEARTFKRELTA